MLEERLRETKRENNELNARIKALEKEVKTAAKAAGSGASEVALTSSVNCTSNFCYDVMGSCLLQMSLKKQEKVVQELMKKLDDMTERKKKLDETVHNKDADIKQLEKVRGLNHCYDTLIQIVS